MNRSQGERRKEDDESPISPTPSLPKSEIFSTKKIYFLNSYTGGRYSDIPHIESDYCPPDEASRRLFHRNGTVCDCDCVSDGFWGCLRRNKKCFGKIFVFSLSTVVIVLLLGSLSYSLILKRGDDRPFQRDPKSDWISHDHNYASPSEDDLSIGIDSAKETKSGGETDFSVTIYETGKESNPKHHYQTVDLVDDGGLQKVEPLFVQPLKISDEKLGNAVVIISDEREPYKQKRSASFFPTKEERNEKDLENFLVRIKFPLRGTWTSSKEKMEMNEENFKANARTVFQPFSLAMPSTPFQSEEYSMETNGVGEDSRQEFSIEDTTENFTSEETLQGFIEENQRNLEDTLENESDEIDDDAVGDEELRTGSPTEIFEETTFYELPETTLATSESDGIWSKETQSTSGKTLTEDQNYMDREFQSFSTDGGENEISETSTDTSPLATSAIRDDLVEREESVESSLQAIATIPDAPFKSKDSQIFEKKSVGFDDDDDDEGPSSKSPSFREDVPRAGENSKIEAISLAEAVKRREESRKYLFLNSRVVGGSSDVRLPTGPDSSKTFETLKTDQQFSFTPSATSQYVFPYQMCLFANPYAGPRPSIRSAQSRTFPLKGSSSLPSPLPDKDDWSKQFSRFPTQQNFLSFSVNNYASSPPRQQNHYPPSGSSFFNFPSQQMLTNNAPVPGAQPIFCTYLQPPLFQFPTVPGSADFSRSKCVDCQEDDAYQTHFSVKEKSYSPGRATACPIDSVPCRDGSNCVPIRNWCDNVVHCPDVSDEAFCSCRERVASERLCDGYLDCPQGEDEFGCFDCPKSAFSCDSVISPESCIPLNKRCDGVKDCAIGNDETDCSALFSHVHDNGSYQVSRSTGFLHRNWRGIWFPVCVDVKFDAWAKEACLGELGYLPSSVEVNFVPVPDYYKGPFIVRNEDGTPSLQDHCKGHLSSYVRCPSIKCGTKAELFNLQEFENRFKRLTEDGSNRVPDILGVPPAKKWINRKFFEKTEEKESFLSSEKKENNGRSKREETGRVVGGKESEPRAWPWTIAIYKDGSFLCGGVILDENWILTAAHCMEQYWKHFYEIRGGMLRRFSFSPMEQVRTVADVIVHENYDPTIMSNDLALLRLLKPFHFDRWVRPACLPSFQGSISNFFSTPLPGTRCVAVGWGALREHGFDADQLREVEVPIMTRCKHKEDLAGAEICAGKMEGGKDTCQGDSGGPLLCKNFRTPLAWYVAGIVSHGEGCARPGEPGAYTRISLFLDWITVNANAFKLSAAKPLIACPGFRCTSGSRLCIPAKWVCNGFTDCLEAEDEKNCTTESFNYEFLTQSSFEEDFGKKTKDNFPGGSRENGRTGKPESSISSKEKESFTEKSRWQEKDEMSAVETENRENGNEPLKTAATFESSTAFAHEYANPREIDGQIRPPKSGGQESGIVDAARENDEGASELDDAEDSATTDVAVESSKSASEKIYWETSEDGISSSSKSAIPTSSQMPAHLIRTRETPRLESIRSTLTYEFTSRKQHSVEKSESESNTEWASRGSSAENSTYFQCRKIVQSILKDHRCDGVRDCEDGSDECNCSCVDLLRKQYPALLCDGWTDCPDSSDETDCRRSSDEKSYDRCKTSLREGERNCFALSERGEIESGLGGEPLLRGKGLLAKNEGGAWTLVCQERSSPFDARQATDACSQLGWLGYDRFENVTLSSNCTGFHVTCSGSLASALDQYRVPEGGYLWPWNAFVFSDGSLVCSAVLLRSEWLLASSACLEGVSLSKNYLVAKLGSQNWAGRTRSGQLVRIDAVRLLPDSDVALLHLSRRANQTRFARPIGIPYVFDSDPERDVCVASSGDGNVFLKIVENCPEPFACYDRTIRTPDNCRSDPWIGVVVCQSRIGWYPSSVFSEKEGRCGFSNVKFGRVQEKLKAIYSALDEKLEEVIPPPNCTGFRCPEGFCIRQEEISPDFLSKTDEGVASCHLRSPAEECGAAELKCRNGLCVSKTLFGDGKDDCGDGSDEPENPTCLEYLRLTAPQRICDGKRNCHDKTDEDYNLCGCNEFKFKCALSQHCIPEDFVCDGERDCPGGEDEETCMGRRTMRNSKTRAFEIMQKSYGVWHNMCPSHVSRKTSDALCKDLGFGKGSLVYERNQTILVPKLDPFSRVKLNKWKSVALRSDKPFVRLVEARKNCYVIKCI